MGKVRKNPDEEFVHEIKTEIKRNGGYCVSQFRSKDTKCPCKYLDSMKSGMCLCGLYVKEET